MAITQWKSYIEFNKSDKPKIETFASKWIKNAEKELSAALNRNIKFIKHKDRWCDNRYSWCISLFDLYPDPEDHQLLLQTNVNEEIVCDIHFPIISNTSFSEFEHIITNESDPEAFKVNDIYVNIMPLITAKGFNEKEIDSFNSMIDISYTINNYYYDLNSCWTEYTHKYNVSLFNTTKTDTRTIKHIVNPLKSLEKILQKNIRVWDSYLDTYKDFLIQKSKEIEAQNKLLQSLTRKWKINACK